MIRVLHGDCRALLPTLEAESFHACVTDPPYGLEFMGKAWDNAVAHDQEMWRKVWRVMKPGAHLVAFGGTRTFHRMMCAIEDAGFEYRDTLCWLYASGFPKSHDVSKAIDKAAGAERQAVGVREYAGGHIQRSSADKPAPPIGTFVRTQDDRLETIPATPEAARWAGFGTALKPAWEPIILARKPLVGSVAENVLAHGTGALNIDACRVPIDPIKDAAQIRTMNRGRRVEDTAGQKWGLSKTTADKPQVVHPAGRWPGNLLHDGSAEVEAAFAAFGERGAAAPVRGTEPSLAQSGDVYSGLRRRVPGPFHGDSGSASRFFFSAKADSGDRSGSKHPTVKPTDLMRWLVELVCPPGGVVLDPFAGSGSTGLAADQLGMNAVLIEQSAEYCEDIRRKITDDAGMFADIV